MRTERATLEPKVRAKGPDEYEAEESKEEKAFGSDLRAEVDSMEAWAVVSIF